MDAQDIERFRTSFLSNPSAFVEGARGLCKQAGLGETWDAIKLPLIMSLIAYGGLRAGTAWGRYAQRTRNPNGPVKGPFMKLLGAALPSDEKVLYKGTPEYDNIMAYRAKLDDAEWDRKFNNAVSEGRAKSYARPRYGDA